MERSAASVRWFALALALAACRSAPPEPRVAAQPVVPVWPAASRQWTGHAMEQAPETDPRPVVDIQRKLPEARGATWPLPRPPAMLPHLPIAARADRDCRARSDRREDVYASAWCFAGQGQRAHAIELLDALAGDAPAAERDAIVFDLGELVADGGSRAAVAWLERGPREPFVWDTLVATFLENGDRTAAVAVTAARADLRVPITDCRAEYATISAGGPDVPRVPLAIREWAPNACGLSAADRCLIALDHAQAGSSSSLATLDRSCDGYVAEHPASQALVDVVYAYDSWPAGSFAEWNELVARAAGALGQAGAAEVAVAAAEAAARHANCSPDRDALRDLATRLSTSVKLTAAQRARADRVVAQLAGGCKS